MNRKSQPIAAPRRVLRDRRLRRLASWHTTQQESRVFPLTPAEANLPAPLVFTESALRQVRGSVGSVPAESGGPLGGVRGSGVVEHFHLDDTSSRTAVTYYPDISRLNTLFREKWNPENINLLGVVHSHPAGAVRPSSNDLEYAGRILDGIRELDRFLLPIVQTAPDCGTFSVRGYAATRQGSGVRLTDVPVHVVSEPSFHEPAWHEWDRVRSAYDMNVMESSRVVSVGCGGSAAFLEDLARAGVAEFVLIDPDIIEAPNVATQQAYRSDVGSAKVDAIARRLVDISPTVRVWCVYGGLDELTDAAVRRLGVGWLPGSRLLSPSATLLCAFTDTFEVQARVHRLGLHLGVPVIGGAVYAGGRGVEVTYAVPGVTPACIRCAQQSRYNAYLRDGFRNTVGSAGAPIMATSRLNALKMPLALGILHTVSRAARPDNRATMRFRRLLESVDGRNLVVASLDPDIHETLGMSMFGDGSPVETVLWRRPTPDNPANGAPACPDCGGTGDLSDSVGAFMSTAPMTRVFGDNRR